VASRMFQSKFAYRRRGEFFLVITADLLTGRADLLLIALTVLELERGHALGWGRLDADGLDGQPRAKVGSDPERFRAADRGPALR
jgi:hypothetical protein